jgi:uncharacterized membrane protein
MSPIWWVVIIAIAAVIFVPIKLKILKKIMNKQKENEENTEDF